MDPYRPKPTVGFGGVVFEADRGLPRRVGTVLCPTGLVTRPVWDCHDGLPWDCRSGQVARGSMGRQSDSPRRGSPMGHGTTPFTELVKYKSNSFLGRHVFGTAGRFASNHPEGWPEKHQPGTCDLPVNPILRGTQLGLPRKAWLHLLHTPSTC